MCVWGREGWVCVGGGEEGCVVGCVCCGGEEGGVGEGGVLCVCCVCGREVLVCVCCGRLEGEGRGGVFCGRRGGVFCGRRGGFFLGEVLFWGVLFWVKEGRGVVLEVLFCGVLGVYGVEDFRVGFSRLVVGVNW